MASSPIVRCTFCGSTVSTESTVCPTCGNEIHAQKRFPINSGALALLIGLLSLALLVSGSGEESGIRRTLQSMANRLDQLATDLDPRLAVTPQATDQEVAILLPTPADSNLSTVGNTNEDENHNAGINDPALSLPNGEAGVDISTSQTTSVSALPKGCQQRQSSKLVLRPNLYTHGSLARRWVRSWRELHGNHRFIAQQL